MGRAGKALKQALETNNISQNKLATVMGLDRNKVYRWFHERVDPTAETVAEIVQALSKINPTAAETFVQLYIGNLIPSMSEEE
ncbi:MAG: helix-turn-helix domain-containing protein [Microcoleaceae cyanobacterium]